MGLGKAGKAGRGEANTKGTMGMERGHGEWEKFHFQL
jgi:hypothetical protein